MFQFNVNLLLVFDRKNVSKKMFVYDFRVHCYLYKLVNLKKLNEDCLSLIAFLIFNFMVSIAVSKNMYELTYTLHNGKYDKNV